MNQGLDIFKRAQHLAGGTSDLPYDPSYPGPTNPHESGSGYWTSRLVGTGVGTASNFFVPGLGLLTGPIASWAMRAMQSGMSQNAVQNAVKAYQTSQTGSGQSGDTTTAPATDTSSNATAPTTSTTPSAGIGIDPFGNPADPGEFWSNDFGRWGEGDQYGTTPGNYNPPGPGGGIGTRGVWGGQTTIPIASDPNFTPSLGWAMPAASGGGAYGGNTMAKIALHSGTFRDAATPEQWAFMQNYLSGGGGGGGGGQGVGGAGRPMTQSRQKGDSDIGLKLFKTHQRLQGGENEVRGKEPPFAEGGQWWWEKADEQAKLDDEQGHGPEFAGSETPEQMLDRRRRTAYKTVGVNINGQEVEIPIWDENMTPEQAEGFARDRLEMGLSPFASDMELDAAQNDNAKRRGYAMGTSSVNPGLKLFHAQLKRKKK